MKIQQVVLGLLLSVGMVASHAIAEMAVENKAAVVEVGNKICPVSNEKVGEMGEVVKIEHNGKLYNLCCSMCKKDFKNNPDKFSKIAEDEVSAAAVTE